MKIEILQNYAAEKFFLLAELEQKCSFIYSDMIEGKVSLKEDCVMTFFYALWQFSSQTTNDQPQHDPAHDIIEHVLSIIEKVKNSPYFDVKTSAIVIEASISREQFYEQRTSEQLNTVLNRLKEETSINLIVIAISDKNAASPGLEKCYDITERILPGYADLHQIANLVADSQQTLLGHDGRNHEPVAASEVFQALCFVEEGCENDFLLHLFETKQQKIKHHVKEQEEKLWAQNKYERRSKDSQEDEEDEDNKGKKSNPADFYIQAVGCAIMAIFIYYYLLRYHIHQNYLV